MDSPNNAEGTASDPNALLNNPAADRDNDDVHLPNTKLLPTADTPVEVVLRFPSLVSSGRKN